MPDQIDPSACTSPAPEGPEVIADVWPGDYSPEDLTVTLDYNGDPAGDKYRGTVRMQYNPATKRFTYRLPLVSQATLPPPGNISLYVRVHPGDDSMPPPATYIRGMGYCMDLRN
ncbi:hypothetical protein [Dactylosporangium sp. NPDC000521]|uniref:hypothetical protein n=1 Tax=Dactylosporangium sp. NPDC000521 TaxID=3363975 RepID=UPI0036A35245